MNIKTITLAIASSLMSVAAIAATTKEIANTPWSEINKDNASAVADACIAEGDFGRVRSIVSNNKGLTLDEAGDKLLAAKAPLIEQMNLMMHTLPGSVTNTAFWTKAVAALDFSAIKTDDDKIATYYILLYPNSDVNGLFNTADGMALMKKAFTADKVLGAAIASRAAFNKVTSAEAKAYAAETFEAARDADTTSGELLCRLLQYAFYYVENGDEYVAKRYRKDMFTPTYYWMFPLSSKPAMRQAMADMLAYIKESMKPCGWKDDLLKRYAAVLDKTASTKDASLGVIEFLSDSSQKLTVAYSCNDANKVIEILTKCDTSLKPSQITAALGMLNALDPDYKTADVVKALKAVNQRYTLKLYDDRDIWEPVLSMVRAMIEVR